MSPSDKRNAEPLQDTLKEAQAALAALLSSPVWDRMEELYDLLHRLEVAIVEAEHVRVDALRANAYR